MIKYTKISGEEYSNLSDEEIKKLYRIEYDNGNKEWRLNGFLHREDGPAKEYYNGNILWWLNGNLYPFKEWLELTPISDDEKVFLRLKYDN